MQGKFYLISLVMNCKIAVVSSDDLFYVLQCSFFSPHCKVSDLFQSSLFAVYCSLT